MFQRTPFADIVREVIAQLELYALKSTWVGIQEKIPMMLGDYLIAIQPGSPMADEGTATGTGPTGTIIRRTITLTIKSRSYEDEGERAFQALMEHLTVEELALTAMQAYMSDLLTEPMCLTEGGQSVRQETGVITSSLPFRCVYPALLLVPQMEGPDSVHVPNA